MKLNKLIENRVRKARERKTIPINPLHSDLYLVEYPKSGATWLSTILANTALIESGKTERATFVTARKYIPDIHISRDIGELGYTIPSNRIIKSHDLYNSRYCFVIYLVREPFDVMTSYYNFMMKKS